MYMTMMMMMILMMKFPMLEGSDPLSLDRPKRPDGPISPFSCEFGAISYNGMDFISNLPQHQ